AGMTRTPHATELLYARSRVVMYARAFNLQAIDMVCIDYKNQQQLEAECLQVPVGIICICFGCIATCNFHRGCKWDLTESKPSTLARLKPYTAYFGLRRHPSA